MKKTLIIIALNIFSWFYLYYYQVDNIFGWISSAICLMIVTHTILLLPFVIAWCSSKEESV